MMGVLEIHFWSINFFFENMTKLYQVKYRDVPGIDTAYLAMDTEEGVEVVWNEAMFSGSKKFKSQVWFCRIFGFKFISISRRPVQIFTFHRTNFNYVLTFHLKIKKCHIQTSFCLQIIVE